MRTVAVLTCAPPHAVATSTQTKENVRNQRTLARAGHVPGTYPPPLTTDLLFSIFILCSPLLRPISRHRQGGAWRSSRDDSSNCADGVRAQLSRSPLDWCWTRSASMNPSRGSEDGTAAF